MMRALTVVPGQPGSVRLETLDEGRIGEGSVLVRALAVGICETDRKIVAGEAGSAPPGGARLVLGHESLGRVEEAPAESGLAAGDLVVGIVRRPDPLPCECCAAGEWDMCRNGGFTEHGIKQLDGFAREWYRLPPGSLVRIDDALGDLGVLLEPASILAKAWEEIDHFGRRTPWTRRTVLVTGAGPIGLLAALLGVQRGLEVHVLDRVTEGPKPDLVRDLGAIYHTRPLEGWDFRPDIAIECTGAPSLVLDLLQRTAPTGVVSLVGVPSGESPLVDATALARDLVLGNQVVFGSVNANRRHYDDAVRSLAAANRNWLARLVTRRVPLERWSEALDLRPGDVKTVIEFGEPLRSRSS